MADNLLLPVCLDRITDANGVPYGGAKVYVYDAGTTDEKNVYTDADLMNAAANPIVADAGGYIAPRYIGTGSYKLVTTDANDVPIKPDEDNLPGALNTTPFSVSAARPQTPVISTGINRIIAVGELGSTVWADPSGGDITITLPSPGDAGDGKRLYVEHVGTSGQVIVQESSTLATLKTTNQSAVFVSNAVAWRVELRGEPNVLDRIPPPQGYLTLVTGTPVMTTDQASKTSVYYAPDVGDRCPIYNGMVFLPTQFSELTLELVTQHLADNIYDVFVFLDPSDGTTVRIGTGPSWADGTSGSVTVGSAVRGTSTGSTECERLHGLKVNKNAMTVRNGSSTYSVAARRATRVGSIYIDGSAGQVTCHVSYGQSRKWGIWNDYNRKEIVLKAGDGTASWTYNSTWRASNNASANSLMVFCGEAEERISARFGQVINIPTTAGQTGAAYTGIGWNSTSSPSGGQAIHGLINGDASATFTSTGTPIATYDRPGALGLNRITALEQGVNVTSTFFGTELQGGGLVARWRG